VAGVTFHGTSRMLRNESDITGVSQVSLGISDLKVADYFRSTIAFVLQTISDVLHFCWSFCIALDVAHTTSYIDVRVRAYFAGTQVYCGCWMFLSRNVHAWRPL
jgi:hypothetical protein